MVHNGRKFSQSGHQIGRTNPFLGGILLPAYTSITDLYENLRLYYELGVNCTFETGYRIEVFPNPIAILPVNGIPKSDMDNARVA
ncbi:MAG: hypothetical protein M3044_21705 [Thermoproteota archaeon]|nr:hypothetical protein [Thermoproteota archaeon]